MSQKIAVMFVHGVGVQGAHYADTMQATLLKKMAKIVGQDVTDEFEFAEVNWAQVLNNGERELMGHVTMGVDLDWIPLRKFVMDFAADAIAYQPGKDRHQVYDEIHAQLGATLTELATRAGEAAPLVVIAHSLGSVIVHNYFYDLQNQGRDPNVPLMTPATALEAGRTFALFFMLGSPLALWSLRYADLQDYAPIDFPGDLVTSALNPKWVNLYDEDDILAYPIGYLTAAHEQLVEDGVLRDQAVRAGGMLTGWNPAAHVAYWSDGSVAARVATRLAALRGELAEMSE